jgi:tetratricopeptide (TPR) repeat protein
MEKNQNDEGIAGACQSLGLVYDYKQDYKQAIKYYTRALPILEKNNNEVDALNIKGNLGVIYFNEGEFRKAEQYMKEQLGLSRQLENLSSEVSALVNLGELYGAMGKHQESITLLKEGIVICNSLNMPEYMEEAYKILARNYFLAGDFKNAYLTEERYINLKDSLLNESNLRQMNEMSAKYESEKKDKELIKKDAEIKIQAADAAKKSLQRNALVVGFVFIFLVALLILRGYRNKQKVNMIILKQKREVENSKRIIEQQKQFVEEKQKEIVDSINYASRIQRAMITNEKYIDKSLKKSVKNG